jgi:glycosyltransferase involved in cell wall biosynthesis
MRVRRTPPVNRLGIYVDDVYRVGDDGRISADRAFLLFACEVGRRFDRLTVFGRAVQSRTPADYLLPPEVELIGLPHYHDLKAVRAVARASGGTARAMWRGLAQTDTVWVFGPHPFGYLLLVLALLRGKRAVLGVRQETVAYARNRMPGVPWWSPRLLGVRVLDAVHRLLARWLPATLVGPAIVEQYGGERPGVLDMTVSLVPAAVVAADGRPPAGDHVELLTVGRLEVEKNPLLVVEMLAALERRHPGRYRLTWIGRGGMESEVLARAKELGVAELLELRGYVPFGEELLDLYRRSDAFVHVSWTEGVPQVLIEAMACATPVIATAVGGVPRVLDGGAAGLLVPPGDLDALVAAVERVAGDEALRRELAGRGLAVARTLTLEAQSERTAEFIQGRA